MKMSDHSHAHTALPPEKEILTTVIAGSLFHGTYLCYKYGTGKGVNK
jgi:hypothetical protein